ncbi:MAG: hypothetical protein GKR93_12045 [Gammaproteobacteria bacterium]|nr:hypothetical protein [Gammaproteobacteria bacterium]
MKPVVHLVHGFNVWEPRKTVGKLQPYFLAGAHPTNMVNYYWTGLYLARKKNPKIAERLAKVVGPNDTVVGHSNGCAIIKIALDKGMHCKRAIFIHPALDVDADFRRANVERIDVWYDKSDEPVKWAAMLSSIIPQSWLEARPWGAAGAYGLQNAFGSKVAIRNHNETALGFTGLGHSGIFRWDVLPLLGPKVVIEN